jgi:hypothetical protein
MKNKKFTFLGLALVVAGSLVLTNCTKNKTNKIVEPDTDTEAARDVARAVQTVVEINDIVAPLNEDNTPVTLYTYYAPLSMSVTTGTVTTVVNSTAPIVNQQFSSKFNDITFSNTIGKDGIRKNGMIHCDFSATAATANADKYRHAGWDCKVTSPSGLIWNNDTIFIYSYRIFNTTTVGFPGTGASPLQPSKGVKITWQITANIAIHREDGKWIKWNGTLNRTLENTNNTSVPMPPGTLVTTFTVFPSPYTLAYYNQRSYCSYTGSGKGDAVANGDTYVMEISSDFPLMRNMNSSPEAFTNPVSNMLITPEKHPFVSGVMYVDPGTKTKRKVDFGMPDVVDYDAKVTIDGITYGVDMKY